MIFYIFSRKKTKKQMKVKEELNLDVLLNYGFKKIDKELETKNEDYLIASYDYAFVIGHSRRGQFYYLLVREEKRDIILYASEPDGSGGVIMCPDVLIKLSVDGVLEESCNLK